MQEEGVWQMTNGRYKTIAIFTIVVVIGYIALLISRVEIPRAILLANLSIGKSRTTFTPQKGHKFDLILAVEKNSLASTNQISGKLKITNKTTKYEMQFDARKSVKSNWLANDKFDAYVVTRPSNGPRVDLDAYLLAGVPTIVEIDFNESAENGPSLWVAYLARWIDTKLYE